MYIGSSEIIRRCRPWRPAAVAELAGSRCRSYAASAAAPPTSSPSAAADSSASTSAAASYMPRF